jgi:hypothetical protein
LQDRAPARQGFRDLQEQSAVQGAAKVRVRSSLAAPPPGERQTDVFRWVDTRTGILPRLSTTAASSKRTDMGRTQAAFFVIAVAGAGLPFLLQMRHRRTAPGEAMAMNRIATSLTAVTFALAAGALALPAQAEILQTQTQSVPLSAKVQQEQHMNLPTRGMTMDQVKREYGAPLKVLATRGGSSKYQPPIHRWEYPKYIVYFEYKHVIHSVLRTPGPNSL